MSNMLLSRCFTAKSAIPEFSIVKIGTADWEALLAASGNDSIIGVSTDIPANTGERCDVILNGTADILYGGTITRGDWLTADSNGRAVTAAPAAGVNSNVIGRAQVSGVLGDIGAVIISASRIQG